MSTLLPPSHASINALITPSSTTVHQLLSFCHTQLKSLSLEPCELSSNLSPSFTTPATILLPQPFYLLMMMTFKEYTSQSTFGLFLPSDFDYLLHSSAKTPTSPTYQHLLTSISTNMPLSLVHQTQLLHLFNITGLPCYHTKLRQWDVYPILFPFVPIGTYFDFEEVETQQSWLSKWYHYYFVSNSPSPSPLITISSSLTLLPSDSIPIPLPQIESKKTSSIDEIYKITSKPPSSLSPRSFKTHLSQPHYLHIPTSTIEYSNFYNMSSIFQHLLNKTTLSHIFNTASHWFDDFIAIFPFFNQIVHNISLFSEQPQNCNSPQEESLTNQSISSPLILPLSQTSTFDVSTSTIAIKHFISTFFNHSTRFTFSHFYFLILYFSHALISYTITTPPDFNNFDSIQSKITPKDASVHNLAFHIISIELLSDFASFLFLPSALINFLLNPIFLKVLQDENISPPVIMYQWINTALAQLQSPSVINPPPLSPLSSILSGLPLTSMRIDLHSPIRIAVAQVSPLEQFIYCNIRCLQQNLVPQFPSLSRPIWDLSIIEQDC